MDQDHNNHSAQDGHPEKDCAYCGAAKAGQALLATDKVGDFNVAAAGWHEDGTSWPEE